MGAWSDAVAFSKVSGGTPDVANVRTNQVKSGFGLSLLQSMSTLCGFISSFSTASSQFLHDLLKLASFAIRIVCHVHHMGVLNYAESHSKSS